MKLIEVRIRRKHLAALVLEPSPDRTEIPFEVDSVGYPVLDVGLVAEQNLLGGQELSTEQFRALVKESALRRAKSRALWYLSRGDLSKKELIKKLSRVFPKEAAETAAGQMEEYGYLNDERYAAHLAERLLTERRVAPRVAKQLMAQKGVDRETATRALETVECDTVAVIGELIEKKYKNKLTPPDDLRRTVQGLARRGFSYSDIRAALARYQQDFDYIED